MGKEVIFVHVPYRMLLDNLGKIVDLRINCEIYFDGNSLDSYKDAEIKLINDIFEKHGLEKTIHGPIYDLNPGSLDPEIRRISKKRIEQTLALCYKLNSKYIVFHHGFHHVYYKNHKESWLRNSCEIWQPLVKEALEKEISLLIENSFDPEPDIILELIERVNSVNFLACFDIGHFNAFGKKSVFEIFKEYPEGIIGEIHLSDNLGDFDSHLALGKGNIDFKKFFKLLKERRLSPIITIEPHSLQDIKPSLEYLFNIRSKI